MEITDENFKILLYFNMLSVNASQPPFIFKNVFIAEPAQIYVNNKALL